MLHFIVGAASALHPTIYETHRPERYSKGAVPPMIAVSAMQGAIDFEDSDEEQDEESPVLLAVPGKRYWSTRYVVLEYQLPETVEVLR